MSRLLILFILLISFRAAALESIVSFLSQKTNEIRNLELCSEASAAENLALSKNFRNCPVPKGQVSFLSHDEISEQIFFDSAATTQLEADDCLTHQADQLLVDQKSLSVQKMRAATAQNFSLKIPKLIQIKNELEPIEDELAEMDRKQVTSPMGETMPDTYVDEGRRQALKKRQTQLKRATAILTKSLWQGGHHFVREFIQEQMKKKNFNPQNFLKAFLQESGEGSLNSLLQKIRSETVAEKAALFSKSDKKTPLHFNLNDKDKVRLYRDQNWLRQSSSSTIGTGLSCRLEGRYGIGRERFYSAAEFVGGAALTLLPGGLYLAVSRGLLTLAAAQTLAMAGISLAGVAVTYEQKCPKSALHVSMQVSCQLPSENMIQEIQGENCAADLALSALNVPFPELKSAGLLAFGLGATLKTEKIAPVLKTIYEEAKNLPNPQVEILKAREAGRFAAAQRAEAAIRQKLESGEMKITGKVEGSATGAFYVDFGDGIEGIWKPALGRDANGKAEIAVEKIDRHLGSGWVPVTVPRKLHDFEGTVQLRITNLKPGKFKRDPEALAYFDYLIANKDRHEGNFLVTEDGRLFAIDHGKAFEDLPTQQLSHLDNAIDLLSDAVKKRQLTESLLKHTSATAENSQKLERLKSTLLNDQKFEAAAFKSAMKLASSMTPPKAVVDRLRRTTRSDWTTLLGQELTEQQMNELIVRQKRIIESIDRSEATFGSRIYSESVTLPSPMMPGE